MRNFPAVAAYHVENLDNWPSRDDMHPLAGLFQPFWTFKIEKYPVTSRLEIRRSLEHEVGTYFNMAWNLRASLTRH